jgi:hypothetical protein
MLACRKGPYQQATKARGQRRAQGSMGEGLGSHFHALLFDIVGKPGHQVDDEACHARARQVISHVLRSKHSPAMRACVQADEGRGGRRGRKGGRAGTEDEGLKRAPAEA